MSTDTAKLHFLGATKTVTGSKTAIMAGSDPDKRAIVDCGLFQGPKELRLRNREPLPVKPESFNTVLLTHGHLDHCGYLPRLVKDGFSGQVLCTPATADIARIILLDSAHLQEEEAAFANKRGYSKHSPAKPLYTTEDALKAIDLFQPVPLDDIVEISPNFSASFHEAGHILGSTSVKIDIKNQGTVLFSGDLGRYGAPILPDPAVHTGIDTVIVESTYGGRLHDQTDTFSALATIVNESMERGGVLVIPAFALGRTQLLLFALRQLKAEKTIQDIPIYIDSPMAIKVTGTHNRHTDSFDIESRYLVKSGSQPLDPPNLHIYRSVEESKSLNDLKGNAIIISASGMATGGRILHHLANRLPQSRNTILFIGYQAAGTRGRTILDGTSEVKIHGNMIPIKAAVSSIQGFSAHADRDELLIWLRQFDKKPSKIFLNHGETESLTALKSFLESDFGSDNILTPDYLDKFDAFTGLKIS